MNSTGLAHAGFWDLPLDELERILEATPGGLTSKEAAERRSLSHRCQWRSSVSSPG